MPAFLQYFLTRLAGVAAHWRIPFLTPFFIRWFIRHYGVDMHEASNPEPSSYATFNAFFTRPLKAGIRPIADEETVLVSPADGVLAQCGSIDDGRLIQAKGKDYSVAALLADSDAAERFANGFYATIYLSPRDYHRVHMPIDGRCTSSVFVPGRLESVSLQKAASIDALFANNERVVNFFDTPMGEMAVVLVGATVVGSMELVWQGTVNGHHPKIPTHWEHSDKDLSLEKCDEMGRFNIGSTVIVLCADQPDASWIASHAIDTPILMGQPLAHLADHPA